METMENGKIDITLQLAGALRTPLFAEKSSCGMSYRRGTATTHQPLVSYAGASLVHIRGSENYLKYLPNRQMYLTRNRVPQWYL